MSWLSVFFRKSSTKVALSLLKKLLFAFVGKISTQLADAAIEEVKKAEATNLSGPEKLKIAYTNLRDRFEGHKNVTDRLIRAAIEVAVETIDPKSFRVMW